MKKAYALGISLLELLLVIAVAGIIITVSVRYFQSAEMHNDVATAIRQINSVTHASYNWLNLQKQPNFSDQAAPGGSSGTEISITELENANLLSPQEAKDPWHQDITVAPGDDPTQVRISIPGMPKDACLQLAEAMKNKTTTQLPSTGCTGHNITYYGDF